MTYLRPHRYAKVKVLTLAEQTSGRCKRGHTLLLLGVHTRADGKKVCRACKLNAETISERRVRAQQREANI
jgi:hypothetical protein